MDAEVRKAKAHVREREAAIRNKVEQVGRQTIAAERPTEEQVPKAKADEETSRRGREWSRDVAAWCAVRLRNYAKSDPSSCRFGKGKMLNGCKVFRVADPRSSGKRCKPVRVHTGLNTNRQAKMRHQRSQNPLQIADGLLFRLFGRARLTYSLVRFINGSGRSHAYFRLRFPTPTSTENTGSLNS